MRLARWWVVIVLALALCGCAQQSPEQRLVGRWGGDTVMSDGQTRAHARITVSISSDGTFSAIERIDGVPEPRVVSGTWKLERDGSTVSMHANGALMTAIFTLDGNRLSSRGAAEPLVLSRLYWWQSR